MLPDRTWGLLTGGYDYLSRLRARTGHDTVPFRLLGQRATCLVGPDAARFFYDRSSFDRVGVVPPTVQKSLFGDAGVQLIDGRAHLHRKALFTDVLGASGSASLTEEVRRTWRDAAQEWPDRDHVVLFDAAADVLARAVHAWMGVPLSAEEATDASADMVAMVDGFASLGSRFTRGRSARKRQEHKLEQLVDDARAAATSVEPGTPFDRFLRHQDQDGAQLDAHTAAVEVLNVLRPCTAVSWFIAYAAHALHFWPIERERLLADGADRAVAFAQEVRRFYPFAPFLGARAMRDVVFDGVELPRDSLGVLDVFGHNHHPQLWPEPFRFDSERHLRRPPGPYDLVAQGGGDVATGHRCPGEDATVQIVAAVAPELAAMGYSLPGQDLRVTRRRIPARVRSGMVLKVARPPR